MIVVYLITKLVRLSIVSWKEKCISPFYLMH